MRQRHFRELECWAADTDDPIAVYSQVRFMDSNDSLLFIGHNGAYLDILVADENGVRRWIQADVSTVVIPDASHANN